MGVIISAIPHRGNQFAELTDQGASLPPLCNCFARPTAMLERVLVTERRSPQAAMHPADRASRIVGLHRGTVYNILRTLQAEGFVAYDKENQEYSLALRLLEFAHGVLHKSGLMEVSRPLMHAIAERHDATIYLSRVMGACRALLLDWVGTGYQTDVYLTVGRQYFPLLGAPGVLLAAFSEASRETLLAESESARWFRRPSREELPDRIEAARASGMSIDRGSLHNGLTQISAPILSGDTVVLTLTAACRSDECGEEKIEALGRDMMAAAHRISDALRIVRLS